MPKKIRNENSGLGGDYVVLGVRSLGKKQELIEFLYKNYRLQLYKLHNGDVDCFIPKKV